MKMLNDAEMDDAVEDLYYLTYGNETFSVRWQPIKDHIKAMKQKLAAAEEALNAIASPYFSPVEEYQSKYGLEPQGMWKNMMYIARHALAEMEKIG